LLLAAIPLAAAGGAQNRMTYSVASADSGHIALGLAIRKLGVSATLMQAPAHPDDETNALFALFGLGMGMRTVDVQNNRGEGGQNEIGPELFRDIGVLRTSELLAAHRIDGAEQFFTRAIDYGYSFDPEEVINKWGRDAIIGDYVRLIRTIRPDVLITMNIQGRGGDRAHEATTVLVREAYKVAGNAQMYPEQLREGLRPWQPRKLYFSAGFGGGGRGPSTGSGRGGGRGAPGVVVAPDPAPGTRLTRVDTQKYDELLGRTYSEIGTDARSNHKCQGANGLPPLPGFGGGRGFGGAPSYQLIDSTIAGQMQKDETSVFDGIDTSIAGIARYAGANPPPALSDGLAAIAHDAQQAQAAFAAGTDAATVEPIEAGLSAVRTLRAALGARATIALAADAKAEVDFRLAQKERDFENAFVAAHGLTFDAVADDGLVIAGQPVRLSLLASNRGPSAVGIVKLTVDGFDAPSSCPPGDEVKADAVYTCSVEARIPKGAPLTSPYFTDDYWSHPSNPAINAFDPKVPFGVAFAPTPFRVTFMVRGTSGIAITRDVPVQFRYVKDIYNGDKRMELNVVPAFSVRTTPTLAVVPAAARGQALEREIHVSVTNGTKGAAQATVMMVAPAGFSVTPPAASLSFAHEDEALSARFTVVAPASAKAGEYALRATVTSTSTGAEQFSVGYQEIEYPHIQRRQVIKPGETALKVVDVKTVPNLNVGYVNGVGDQVPPALEQLGAKVHFIEQDELAWGDLSHYDVIVTGVRAYERRNDLRAYNRRLLEYAESGGTVIVQYNKFEFNQRQFGPYPAQVSGNRVSDENVPVKILVPNHPVFNTPNKIGPATWANWTQERGLYFLGEKDPKYVDLISMTDSFQDNPGEKLGSMVEARVGKGRWIYLGLGLWRQLPAGTDGAYQLLANLIALGKLGG
jgi:LmbE family N-acetylglucosaminyl deacetylase